MSKQKRLAGFTLIEILVVVALIAILAAITFIAINPAKNFADTRNAQRSSDLTQILNAVTQYTSEQGHALGDLGTVPTCPTTAPLFYSVGTATPEAGMVNLTTLLVDEYIVGIPSDPTTATAGGNSGYAICQTSGGRVQVSGAKEVPGGTPAPFSVSR